MKSKSCDANQTPICPLPGGDAAPLSRYPAQIDCDWVNCGLTVWSQHSLREGYRLEEGGLGHADIIPHRPEIEENETRIVEEQCWHAIAYADSRSQRLDMTFPMGRSRRRIAKISL